MQRIDLVGQRFGYLVVLERAEDYALPCGQRQVQYLCQCDCGNKKVVRGLHLRGGNTKSCGCHRGDSLVNYCTTHGKSNQRIYNTYRAMKERCYNKHNIEYKNYGARGITVCDAWLKDFNAFYSWAMENGYADGLTIDRINNEGNYEPTNCQWITRSENSRKRNKEYWRNYHEGKVRFRGKKANAST